MGAIEVRKGDLVVQVDSTAYPGGKFTVEAYFPVPGLAVHRYVPPYPEPRLLARSKRWRKWTISHVNSGLRVNGEPFKRLRDALLACKLIADMYPWTLSADKLIRCGVQRHRVIHSILRYAAEGYSEAEIASLVLESELKDGS
jgi:hypothetical protein